MDRDEFRALCGKKGQCKINPNPDSICPDCLWKADQMGLIRVGNNKWV